MAAALHNRHLDLQRRFDPSVDTARSDLVSWYTTLGRQLIPVPTPLPDWAEQVPPPRGRIVRGTGGHGVNLVGFARAEFGIGEDVRSLSAALEAVGYPHVIVDVKSMPNVRATDESRAHLIATEMSYPVSIFCLTAFDAAGLFLERGPEIFGNTFNIGYWPWEFEHFPAVWVEAFELVDELWAATRVQWRAYREASQGPVFLMPPAVLIPASSILQRCGPPDRKPHLFRFIFPFDPNSFLARKNPVAAIRAFRLAFPAKDRSVELVLRVNGNPSRSAGWRAVRAAARGDTRVVMIFGTMVRAASLALVRNAECLISPHRSEGFGRNIAEAIMLGVPVLATGGSGPDDFLKRGERVAFRPRMVALNEYPFAEGLMWNDPMLADLARRMARMRKASHAGGGISPRVRRTTQYAPRTVGMIYKRRLVCGLAAQECQRQAGLSECDGSAGQGYLPARLGEGR
jgi:glycosyltransferase involved in cell wall biosynthesis